jgi:hypothetical protein
MYELYNPDGVRVFINETDIANEFDKKYMYKRAVDYNNTQWLDVENEHFMVWMRMETFPFFKKIWGFINDDLAAGKYSFKIKNSKKILIF